MTTKTEIKFGKMDREGGIAPVLIDGAEEGEIVKSHRYGDTRYGAIESYEAWFSAGCGDCRVFTVKQYGSARSALAAAKAGVRAEVPLSIEEKAADEALA